MTRRSFNRVCAGTLGGVMLGGVVRLGALAQPQLWALPDDPDPRGNLGGYLQAFAPAEGCAGRDWIIPAEHDLTPVECGRLRAFMDAGARVVYELPARCYQGRQERDRGLTRPLLRVLRPILLHGEDGVCPYLHCSLGARSWYVRHDSEGVALQPLGATRVLAVQAGQVLAAEFGCGAGRLLVLGTRMGAPIGRGDGAAHAFLQAWFTA